MRLGTKIKIAKHLQDKLELWAVAFLLGMILSLIYVAAARPGERMPVLSD